MKLLNLADVLALVPPGDRFIRRLPEPGETVCGATPPPRVHAEELDTLEWDPPILGITPCVLPPHPAQPGVREIAHDGLIVSPGPVGPVLTQWRWLARRELGQVVVR